MYLVMFAAFWAQWNRKCTFTSTNHVVKNPPISLFRPAYQQKEDEGGKCYITNVKTFLIKQL